MRPEMRIPGLAHSDSIPYEIFVPMCQILVVSSKTVRIETWVADGSEDGPRD